MKSFDQRVLDITKKIPRGRVATYKDIAEALGTTAYRAVGQALRRNQHPKLFPCYKVVKSDGSIGGYNGSKAEHIKKKVRLLEKDGIPVRDGKIELEKHGWKPRKG